MKRPGEGTQTAETRGSFAAPAISARRAQPGEDDDSKVGVARSKLPTASESSPGWSRGRFASDHGAAKDPRVPTGEGPQIRRRVLLLPPDLRDWVPEDDMVHFVIEAVEYLPMRHFKVNQRGTGSAQYPPRVLLSLLVYSYANGIFSSRAGSSRRRIETWRCVFSRLTPTRIIRRSVLSANRIRRRSTRPFCTC